MKGVLSRDGKTRDRTGKRCHTEATTEGARVRVDQPAFVFRSSIIITRAEGLIGDRKLDEDSPTIDCPGAGARSSDSLPRLIAVRDRIRIGRESDTHISHRSSTCAQRAQQQNKSVAVHAKCHSAHRWTTARPFNFCRRPRRRRRRPLSARSQRCTPPSLHLFTPARRVRRNLRQQLTLMPSPPPRIGSVYTRLSRSSNSLIFLFPHQPLRRRRLRLWPGGLMWPAICFIARRRVRFRF